PPHSYPPSSISLPQLRFPPSSSFRHSSSSIRLSSSTSGHSSSSSSSIVPLDSVPLCSDFFLLHLPPSVSHPKLRQVLAGKPPSIHDQPPNLRANNGLCSCIGYGIRAMTLFIDAFAALRLREACINSTELCKKKNQDRLWVDEIVAMQAAHLELPSFRNSGITLAGDEIQGC
ncbi:COP1-interacting protein 7, partial [Linum grandiflorum]